MITRRTDRVLMYIVGLCMLLLAFALIAGRGDVLIGFQVLIAWLKTQDWFSVVEQIWLVIRLTFVILLFIFGILIAFFAALNPKDTEAEDEQT